MTIPYLPRGALPGTLSLGTVEDFAKQIGEADLFNVFPRVPTSVRESEAFFATLSATVWMKVFRKGTVRAGQASSRRKEVQINSLLFTLGTQQHVRETFLHETAHVLADLFYKMDCNHDWRWVRMARLLGDTGDRCHNYSYLLNKQRAKKLTYICVTCRQLYHRAQRLDTTRMVCGKCRGELRLKVEVPVGLKEALGL